MLKLKTGGVGYLGLFQPPSGGCVLKQLGNIVGINSVSSRLQAAVC